MERLFVTFKHEALKIIEEKYSNCKIYQDQSDTLHHFDVTEDDGKIVAKIYWISNHELR